MSWLDFANYFLSNQKLHSWSWINRISLGNGFFWWVFRSLASVRYSLHSICMVFDWSYHLCLFCFFPVSCLACFVFVYFCWLPCFHCNCMLFDSPHYHFKYIAFCFDCSFRIELYIIFVYFQLFYGLFSVI